MMSCTITHLLHYHLVGVSHLGKKIVQVRLHVNKMGYILRQLGEAEDGITQWRKHAVLG